MIWKNSEKQVESMQKWGKMMHHDYQNSSMTRLNSLMVMLFHLKSLPNTRFSPLIYPNLRNLLLQCMVKLLWLTAHTHLELYPGIEKCAQNGTKISFLYVNQPFKLAQKEKNSTRHFWKNVIFRFLPYKATSRIRGKITK